MHKVEFFAEPYSAILSIDKTEVDVSKVEEKILKEGFALKNEFHITIFGKKAGRQIKSAANGDVGLLSKVKDLLESIEWNYELLPEYFHMKRTYDPNNPNDFTDIVETRETIIQRAQVPQMEKFFEDVSKILSIHIDPQFPHVTLATKGTNESTQKRAIGIDTEGDFERLKTGVFNT